MRHMMTLDKLATEVRRARKAKGFSQSELGRRANVSRAHIDRLENRRLSDVGFSALMRILRALDVDLALMPYNHGRPTLTELRRHD